ncbi:putative transposase [Klebsiella pneumoniae]|nr:putative transposase [Klebsiella pneumoniae]
MAHVFGERTLATLERLLGLLSAFEVVVWMTDGWPLYESRLKGELHVISKRYTQRIERHNLNLRQHLARLGRKSLSFSKIGCDSHYLNIKLSVSWSHYRFFTKINIVFTFCFQLLSGCHATPLSPHWSGRAGGG